MAKQKQALPDKSLRVYHKRIVFFPVTMPELCFFPQKEKTHETALWQSEPPEHVSALGCQLGHSLVSALSSSRSSRSSPSARPLGHPSRA